MAFNHKVHHFDTKGNLRKKTPYSMVARQGSPLIYFDHAKKRFFNPGDMQDLDPAVVPNDVWERYMGRPKEGAKKVAHTEAVKARAPKEAARKRGRPPKAKVQEATVDEGPIVVTADGASE